MYPILAGSFNLLEVNPGLVFWTVITFLVVLFFLWMFAWKPLINALDKRNDKVQEELQESQKLREDAENLLKEYEKKIDFAKEESNNILAESRKNAEIDRQRILDKTRSEVNDIQKRLGKEIEMAKINAIDEIQNSVADITLSVLSKILKDEVNKEEHKKMIIRELKAFKN